MKPASAIADNLERVCYNHGMLIRKAFKFRLNPNKFQQAAFAVQFGHTRFVYNHFLTVRKEHYEQTGVGLGYQDNARMLVEMKRNPDTAWLKEADSPSPATKFEGPGAGLQKLL